MERPVSVYEKRCATCKEVKKATEFYREKKNTGGLHSYCKACCRAMRRKHEARKKQSPEYMQHKRDVFNAWHDKNLPRQRMKSLESYYRCRMTPRGRMSRLVQCAKNRAKKLGIAFELTTDWLMQRFEEQVGCCKLTGIRFNFEVRGIHNAFGPSLDKINPEGGYTRENTRLVCNAVNLGMNQFGEEAFERTARAFLEKRGFMVRRYEDKTV